MVALLVSCAVMPFVEGNPTMRPSQAGAPGLRAPTAMRVWPTQLAGLPR